jgi:hypothetical protein
VAGPDASLQGVSLSVHVFVRDTSGRRTILSGSPGASDLAGFESWRDDVWGSAAVRALGARFFPRLASGDLYVEPARVPDFQSECVLVREHLDTVAAGAGLFRQRGIAVCTDKVVHAGQSRAVFRDLVSERLAAIEDVVRRAREIGGGVLIW